MSRRAERWVLAGVLAVAALVRLGWAAYAARPPVGLHDPGLYRLFADRLAAGEGYSFLDGPTAYYPVGYPAVLGAGFLVTPRSWETGVVVAINVLCQVVAVWLAYRITRRLVGDRPVPALVAAGLVALWPNLVFNSAVALTESLFVVLLLAGVAVLVDGPWDARGPGTKRLVAAGVLSGLAALVRPVSLPILGALLVAWLVAGVGWRRALARTAVVAAAAAVVLLPWVLRNAATVDSAVLSTNTGDNLCMSRRVGGTGAFEFPNLRCFPERFNEIERPESEVARDAHGRDLAFEFVREHPGEEVRLWGRRLVAALEDDADGLRAAESYGEDPFLGDDRRDLLSFAANAWYLVVGVAGTAGLVLLGIGRPRSPAGVLVALCPVALLLSVVAFFGDPRFKLPIVPFLAIGAGVLVARVARVRAGPA